MEERPRTAAHTIGLSDEDCFRLSALYDGRFAEHGSSVKTVGWGSESDQAMRFEVLCRGLNLAGKRILDIGCGLGDFVTWAESHYGPDFDYVGMDLAKDLVNAADARFGGPRRHFIADTLGAEVDMGEFDVIVLSGTLTFKTTDNMATMRSLLGNAFARCRGVLCCNFMTSYSDSQLEKNFHYSPEDVFGFAKSLTRFVILHHDYPLYEFTLQMFRQATLQRQPKP